MTTCVPFLGQAVMYIAGSKNYFLQELMQKSNISHAMRKQSQSLRILEKMEIKLMVSGRSATKPVIENTVHFSFRANRLLVGGLTARGYTNQGLNALHSNR